jgi:hypothetical protein
MIGQRLYVPLKSQVSIEVVSMPLVCSPYFPSFIYSNQERTHLLRTQLFPSVHIRAIRRRRRRGGGCYAHRGD